MGNLIFGTTTIQGRTFDDIKIQTSKAGVPRPIVFGTVRPIVGNIIATTAPRIEKSTEDQGGKGGPSVEVENEEVFRTYAIRICEGPVTGVPRVWRNNELVYERDSEDATQIENNGAFLERAEFFLGSYTQMPSAVMQSAFGIASVHGYRGTCYMVVDDENLTATGGAIPQYAFEVERCEGFVLTSRPYRVESREAVDLKPDLKEIRLRKVNYVVPEELVEVQPSVDEIEIRKILVDYRIAHEYLDIEPSVEEIQLETLVVEYETPQDKVDIEASVESIEIKEVVVRYDQGPEETVDIEPAIEEIEITQP